MLTKFENEELIHAIAEAERGSTGELRVVVARRCKGDVMAEAEKRFVALGLHETAGRTGVLLLVCPKQHKVAIRGDVGIHDRVGDAFWKAVIHRATGAFAEGELLRGILMAVEDIGVAFRRHLPAESGEGNELPDAPIIE